MNSNQALIASIEAFDIDGGPSDISFADRLAKEQSWTPHYTARAIKEYKRFVALAMISNTPVTPSLVIDEVWHTHLVYTRSYWDRLHAILPKKLHHDPTTGGQQQATKHQSQFAETLILYRATFNEAPPADIWLKMPATASPDSKSRNQSTGKLAILATFAVLGIAGCTTLAQSESSSFNPVLIPIIFALAVLFAVLIALAAQKGRRNSGHGSNGSGCSAGGADSTSTSHGHGGGHCSGGGHCTGGHAGGDAGGSSGGDGGSSCGGGCGGGGD